MGCASRHNPRADVLAESSGTGRCLSWSSLPGTLYEPLFLILLQAAAPTIKTKLSWLSLPIIIHSAFFHPAVLIFFYCKGSCKEEGAAHSRGSVRSAMPAQDGQMSQNKGQGKGRKERKKCLHRISVRASSPQTSKEDKACNSSRL